MAALTRYFSHSATFWAFPIVLPLVNVLMLKTAKKQPAEYSDGPVNSRKTGKLTHQNICCDCLTPFGTGKPPLPQSFCFRPDRGVRSALRCANHPSWDFTKGPKFMEKNWVPCHWRVQLTQSSFHLACFLFSRRLFVHRACLSTTPSMHFKNVPCQFPYPTDHQRSRRLP